VDEGLEAMSTAPHTYLSTACLHAAEPGREGLHKDCATDGKRWDGTHKEPARCKFCPSRCICACHRVEEAADGQQ
jgi:hypothetical protein